jgi:catechol 2,3-dioxygenase-like lactoylglutathione lyase family enzyme
MTTTSARPAGSATLMHVALACKDVEESLRFYRDGLGFSRTYEWTRVTTTDGRVTYSGRAVYIELEGHTYIELFPGGVDGPDPGTSPFQHIALIVPSVDEAYRKCLNAGGKPAVFDQWNGEPISAVLNGDPEVEVRVAFVIGPSGESIELYEQYSPIMAR